MQLCDRKTWLRATFEERKSLIDGEEVDEELDTFLNDNQKAVKEFNAVAGIELYMNELEKTLLTPKKDFVSDLHSLISSKNVQFHGFEEFKPGTGFIDAILKGIATIWRIITEFFSNRLKTIERSYNRLKVDFKRYMLKQTAYYKDLGSVDKLIIPTTKPNLRSLKWVSESIECEHKFMKNVFATFPYLARCAGQTITEKELTEKNGDLTGGQNRILTMMQTVRKTISTGFTPVDAGMGNKVILIPGNTFCVGSSNLKQDIIQTPGTLGFNSKIGELSSTFRQADVVSRHMVGRDMSCDVNVNDLTLIMNALEGFLSDIKQHYRSPTTVGVQMEKAVDKAFSQSELSGDAKKAAGRYYSMILRIVKTLTNHEFFDACRVIERGIRVVNGCLIKK